MIKLLRVDHRLLHGQVALSWVKTLGVTAIMVVNDGAAEDDMHRSALRLAKPDDVKLAVKTLAEAVRSLKSEATDQLQLLVITGSIRDAHYLAQACPRIGAINLGGTRHTEDHRSLSNLVSVSDEDIRMLDELVQGGHEVEIRAVASDRSINYTDAVKGVRL